MNLENYFISQLENKHIGDDGAVIGDYVYSKDAFFQNIHFKTEWMSYYQIARKSMLVNISDAVAMNAQPKYALLSVAMPKSMKKEDMKQLACGFKETAKEFGIEIIGGDTISNTKLDITITIVSKTKSPLLRSTAKEGDYVAYTGVLGKSARDLKKLLNLGLVHKKSKFIDIKLRKNFISKAARFLSSGMDISDGLFSDLNKLSSASSLGIKLFSKIDKKIACSGEEYEILFTFNPRDKRKVLRYAKQTRTPITIVAKMQRGRYFNRCKAHHF